MDEIIKNLLDDEDVCILYLINEACVDRCCHGSKHCIKLVAKNAKKIELHDTVVNIVTKSNKYKLLNSSFKEYFTKLIEILYLAKS